MRAAQDAAEVDCASADGQTSVFARLRRSPSSALQPPAGDASRASSTSSTAARLGRARTLFRARFEAQEGAVAYFYFLT